MDGELFGPGRVEDLRRAVADYSLLLTRGYPEEVSLKLVGDRFALRARQRTAVRRCSCSDRALALRLERRVPLEEIRGRTLLIDAFNLVILLESAFGGGIVLRGRDGCLRDLAELRGSYRIVRDTPEVVDRLCAFLRAFEPARADWLLDRPVSNSGRLRVLLAEVGERRGLPGRVLLVPDPDRLLVGERARDAVVATADSRILDEGPPWCDPASAFLERSAMGSVVLDLRSRD